MKIIFTSFAKCSEILNKTIREYWLISNHQDVIVSFFFKKKRNIYAWCGFYTVNFRRLKQMFLSKSLYHTEDIDSLKSNKKRYFTSRKKIFSSGSLKIANLVMLWTNLCPF